MLLCHPRRGTSLRVPEGMEGKPIHFVLTEDNPLGPVAHDQTQSHGGTQMEPGSMRSERNPIPIGGNCSPIC